MPTLSLKKKDLPFLLGGKGEVSVDIGALRPTKPIPEDTDRLLSVSFSAAIPANGFAAAPVAARQREQWQ